MTTTLQANIAFNEIAHRQQSKVTLLGVAKSFGGYWLFFSALSVMASYFTFTGILLKAFEGQNELLANFIALGLSIILEVFKHKSIEWVFTAQSDNTKYLSYIIMSSLIVASMAFHFKGVILLQSNNVVAIEDEAESRKRLLEDRAYELKQGQNKLNIELAKALNNKDKEDDVLAVSTIKTNLITDRTIVPRGISKSRLQAHEANQKDLNIALLMVLGLAELFILFSLVSKYIFKENADATTVEFKSIKEELKDAVRIFKEKQTKNLVTDTLKELEDFEAQKNELKEEFKKPPTLSTTEQQKSYKNEIKTDKPLQIGYDYKNGSNGYFMGSLNQNQAKPNYNGFKVEQMPILRELATPLATHEEQKRTEEKKEDKIEVEKESKKVIDLMMFNHEEGELLKLLFDNNTLGEGDKLIPKRLVLAQTKINEGVLINLYAKLVDMGLVEFKNGYKALANIANQINVK